MAITFIDGAASAFTTATTTFAIPAPTTGGALAAGDVLIANVVWDTASSTAPSVSLPSGWVALTSLEVMGTGTTAMHFYGLAHVVTAAEAASPPASWAVTTSTGYVGNVTVARFRGVDTADLLSVSAPASGYSVAHYTSVVGAKVAPLVTVDTGNSMLVTGSMHRSNSSTITSVDTGYTIAASVSAQAAGRAGGLAYKSQAATGDSTTATWNTSTTNTGSVWQTALAQAPPPKASVAGNPINAIKFGSISVDRLVMGSVHVWPKSEDITRAAGPVAYIPMNGFSADEIGGALGTSEGGIAFNGIKVAPSTNGNSAIFDGVDDAIILPDVAKYDLPTANSVELWFQADDYRDCVLIAKSGGYQWVLKTTSAQDLFFQVATTDASGWVNAIALDFTLNVPHHAVGTFDGSNVKIYLDGVLAQTTPFIGAGQSPAGSPVVGRDPWGGSYFKGRIDELAVYNKALTQYEVVKHYRAGMGIG